MQGERKENDSFLLLFNGGRETIRFALPGPPWTSCYAAIINTSDSPASADTATTPALRAGDTVPLKARSVIVLKIQIDRRLDQPVA